MQHPLFDLLAFVYVKKKIMSDYVMQFTETAPFARRVNAKDFGGEPRFKVAKARLLNRVKISTSF